jgi:hypothetical protein
MSYLAGAALVAPAAGVVEVSFLSQPTSAKQATSASNENIFIFYFVLFYLPSPAHAGGVTRQITKA